MITAFIARRHSDHFTEAQNPDLIYTRFRSQVHVYVLHSRTQRVI